VAERFGSVKNAKAAMKRNQGNGALRRLKADETIKVRFLDEPEDWFKAYYHWIGQSFVWCNRQKSCQGCSAGDKPKMQILANAVIISSSDDRESMKVVVMQMTNTLATTLFKFYDKRETLLDRDYDLTREGSGMNDTVYSADPDDPKKRALSRFEDSKHDIKALIASEIAGEEDEVDEDEPRSTRKSKSSSRRSREEDEYEDEDDEEDEEEEEEDERPRRSSRTRAVAKKKPARRSRHEDEDDEEEEDDEEYEDDEEDDIDYELRKEEERRARAKKSTTSKSKYDGLNEFKKKPTTKTRAVVRRSR
jgi:hypothetical protein